MTATTTTDTATGFVSVIPTADFALAADTEDERNAILRGDGNAIHRAVMGLFPTVEAKEPRKHLGVLWREELGQRILIRSNVPPVRETGALVTRVDNAVPEPGTVARFALTASAVTRVKANGNKITRVPNDPDALAAWFIRRVGDALVDVEFSDIERGVREVDRSFTRDGVEVKQVFPIDATRFEGGATVGDRDALAVLLAEGVGREKAYGCGLLTLITAKWPL